MGVAQSNEGGETINPSDDSLKCIVESFSCNTCSPCNPQPPMELKKEAVAESSAEELEKDDSPKGYQRVGQEIPRGRSPTCKAFHVRAKNGPLDLESRLEHKSKNYQEQLQNMRNLLQSKSGPDTPVNLENRPDRYTSTGRSTSPSRSSNTHMDLLSHRKVFYECLDSTHG